MAKQTTELLIPEEIVMSKIYFIRDHKVMLDSDLAELYGVENKQLKRQVKRNINRFPDDFMFELTKEEYEVLRSQIGTLKKGEHSKYLPYVFTEQGVAMLSGILNSNKAIIMNIAVMRAFVAIRKVLIKQTDIKEQLSEIKERMVNTMYN